MTPGRLSPVKGDYGVAALILLSGQGSRRLSTDSFLGHVASMTKPLLVQWNTVMETRAHGNAIYLPATAVPIYGHPILHQEASPT